MNSKKVVIGIGATVCTILVLIVLTLSNDNNKAKKENVELLLVSVEQAIESFNTTIEHSKYENLNIHDFEVSLENVKSIHNIRLVENDKYKDNTFLEDFARMNTVIDNFFKEDFDKSYIVATFSGVPNQQEDIVVPYNNIEKQCVLDLYDKSKYVFLFGNNTLQGGYMVQTDKTLSITWLSKNGFNSIHPSMQDYSKVYRYISCQRQNEDVKIKLKDGEI
jgi:hypothetical protein